MGDEAMCLLETTIREQNRGATNYVQRRCIERYGDLIDGIVRYMNECDNHEASARKIRDHFSKIYKRSPHFVNTALRLALERGIVYLNADNIKLRIR